MYLFLLFGLVALSRGVEVPEEIKYIIVLDSPMYPKGDGSNKFVDTSNVKVERYNDSTALMYGDINFLKGIADDTIMEIKLLKEAPGNTYEMMFSHDICDMCKELGDEESDYKKYMTYFGIPKKCPIEAGDYTIKNFAVETDDMEINSNHVGRYEANINIYEKTGDTCQDRNLLWTMAMKISIEEG